MKDLKKLLSDLVAFKSYEPVEINKCIDYVNDYLTKGGVTTEIVENGGLKNLIACIGPEGGKTLIANAHIDVVENDPKYFSLKEEGDKWTGPGIFDMKASAAVLMQLLVELKDKELPARIMAQFVPDEEVGGQLGTAHLVDKGYLGDFVMCLEPTHLNISVQSKGVMWLEADFKGRTAHASRPWLGDSAVEKAFNCYEELKKLPFVNEAGRFFKRSSVVLSKISGGDSQNKIPDNCHVTLDVRYLPEQTQEMILEQMKSVFDKYDVDWKQLTHGYPVVTAPENPFVEKLHEVTKLGWPESKIIGQDGSSDARYFTPKGVPGIEFGPGGGNQHSFDEFVSGKNLMIFKEILSKYFTQLF